MHAGYRIVAGPPSVDDYLALREHPGLSRRRRDQVEAAIDGAWAAVHVVQAADRCCVGTGRVIGDGG